MNSQFKTILITTVCVVLAIIIGFSVFNSVKSKNDNDVRYITGVWNPNLDNNKIDVTVKDTVVEPSTGNNTKYDPSEGIADNDKVDTVVTDYSQALRFKANDLLNAVAPYDNKSFIQFSTSANGTGGIVVYYNISDKKSIMSMQYFDAPNNCVGIGTTKKNPAFVSYLKMDESVWGKMTDTKAVINIGGANYTLTPKRDMLEVNCYIYYAVISAINAVSNIDKDVPINVNVDVSKFFDITNSKGEKVNNPLVMSCIGVYSSTSTECDNYNWNYNI